MSGLPELLASFDVQPTGAQRFVARSAAWSRDMVDASEVLAQTVVAASRTVPGKVVRRASGVFARPVRAGADAQLDVDVLADGRTLATVVVTVSQGDRRCATVTLMLDAPSPDLVRHPVQPPPSSPAEATGDHMALPGRELRLVGVDDPDDPDEVGPPRLEAWLRYTPVPERDDLRRALLAHFTGHLAISATLRGHAGLGTAQAHVSLSTAVLALGVTFHEPVDWDGWVLYEHDSTFLGAGSAYVRGQVRDESGRPLASFTQDALVRAMDPTGAGLSASSRL